MTSYWRDCRFCGSRIIMAEDPYGNWQPLDPDGGRHECSNGYSDYGSVRNSTVFLYTYKESDDFCRPTKCRYCGQEVFFVRYNGGSVWFDSLGKPWPKHKCYDDTTTQPNFHFKWPALETIQSPILGIIAKIENQPRGFFARVDVYKIVMKCENGEFVFIYVNGVDKPEAIIGSLVLVAKKTRQVYLNGKTISNIFDFHIGRNENDEPRSVKPSSAIPSSRQKHCAPSHQPDSEYPKTLVQCKLCKAFVRRDRLEKHLRKVHDQLSK